MEIDFEETRKKMQATNDPAVITGMGSFYIATPVDEPGMIALVHLVCGRGVTLGNPVTKGFALDYLTQAAAEHLADEHTADVLKTISIAKGRFPR